MSTGPKPGFDRAIFRIVALYAIIGSAWIYLSDTFLSFFIGDPALLSRLEVFKGLFFILFTSLMLFQLISRFAKRNAETIAELARSESRFQTIYDNVNDALIIHDAATGEIVDVNQTMCNLFGYSHQESLHLQVEDISLAEPPFSHAEGMRRLALASQGTPQIFEWRSKRRNGTIFWSEINMRRATIAGEERVIVMVRDIDGRKKAEEALRRNEETLKVLMEEMPAGVCWTDQGGGIEYLNGCIIDWFGYTRDDVPTIEAWISRTLPELAYRAEIREAWNKALCATRLRRPVAPIEASLTCKDGSRRQVLFSIRQVHHRVIYIFTDITNRESRQSEFIKTQKLESLGVLAGGIAHDFNNILTGILGNISFASLLLEESHPARKAIAHAEQASLRAAELAHQLLTFAKGGEPVKKAVPVEKLVQESLSLALRGAKVQTRLEIPASVGTIEADAGQMNQAFNNVVINALQAMPKGGVLTVKAEQVPLDEENSLRLPAGRYVRLSFSDQGCGIAQQDLQRIFDPYFTTKAGGTGLGLASVHSIVAKHHGKIEVSSTLGKGTTFTFYLPSAGEAVPEPECQPPPASMQGLRGAILVMDDEEPIQGLAANILEYLGYTVVCCAEGEEAVGMYKEAKEAGKPFLSAIMDLTIPAGMGGKEAAQQILAYDPGARLIVSSGYSNDPVMANHAEFGFCAAIVKPYRCADIQQALSGIAACKEKGLEQI
jgi:two-component system, cell cycle sensor histidine kinase and response regulator CckA